MTHRSPGLLSTDEAPRDLRRKGPRRTPGQKLGEVQLLVFRRNIQDITPLT